ncbi:MAG: hypothetical protein HOY78_44415 [Saccharothrix sp.]|nr:hypothetical protein [Saccharothrix sp.]
MSDIEPDDVNPDDRAFSDEFAEAFSEKQADPESERVEGAESAEASTGSAEEPARVVRLPPPPPEGIIRRGPTDDDRP